MKYIYDKRQGRLMSVEFVRVIRSKKWHRVRTDGTLRCSVGREGKLKIIEVRLFRGEQPHPVCVRCWEGH